MLTPKTLEQLKASVRAHGRYRELAEETGLSESWISKFATQPGDNYTLRAVQTIAAHFEQRKQAKAA